MISAPCLIEHANAVLWFGHYVGRPLIDVPTRYLRWLRGQRRRLPIAVRLAAGTIVHHRRCGRLDEPADVVSFQSNDTVTVWIRRLLRPGRDAVEYHCRAGWQVGPAGIPPLRRLCGSTGSVGPQIGVAFVHPADAAYVHALMRDVLEEHIVKE